MKNPLETLFKKNKDLDKKTLIPFLPAGYPDKEKFWQYIHQMDHLGADIIEIGVPFSDPVADGPVVEKASNVSLKNGINLRWILKELKEHKKDISAEIVLMGYCNPFFKFGWENLALEAKEAGVSGIIIADLPIEESFEIQEILKEQNISLIYLIGLNTSKERLKKYAKRATGFVYFVSVLGTTGTRDVLPPELKEKLKIARDIFPIPMAIGFGIKSPKQLEGIGGFIDGVVFGSSLIKHIDSKKDIGEFFEMWRK